MKTIDLRVHLEWAAKRKAELGLEDTPERTEAMRNKGANRTPEKRELMRRVEERARKAGVLVLKSYY